MREILKSWVFKDGIKKFVLSEDGARMGVLTAVKAYNYTTDPDAVIVGIEYRENALVSIAVSDETTFLIDGALRVNQRERGIHAIIFDKTPVIGPLLVSETANGPVVAFKDSQLVIHTVHDGIIASWNRSDGILGFRVDGGIITFVGVMSPTEIEIRIWSKSTPGISISTTLDKLPTDGVSDVLIDDEAVWIAIITDGNQIKLFKYDQYPTAQEILHTTGSKFFNRISTDHQILSVVDDRINITNLAGETRTTDISLDACHHRLQNMRVSEDRLFLQYPFQIDMFDISDIVSSQKSRPMEVGDTCPACKAEFRARSLFSSTFTGCLC